MKTKLDSSVVQFVPYVAILLLFFLFLGITEIYNNLFFKMFATGQFPGTFFKHFFPILSMYAVKSLVYIGVFIIAYFTVSLVFKKFKKSDTASSLNQQNTAAWVRDMLPFLLIFYLLFIDYRSGPLTLTYYFYYINDSLSPFLKNTIGFDSLNHIINAVLSIILFFIFYKFRISKNTNRYIALLLSAIGIATLPNVFYLARYFKVTLIPAVFALVLFFVSVYRFVLPQKKTLGIRIAAFVCLIVLLFGHITFYKALKKNRINVVHIILDTLRQKSFNEKTMPFLYSLKDKGIYFPNSISSSDNTVTTHNAIYYGLYASLVGLEHGPFPQTTITELLRDHGYHTAVVSANGRFCIVNGFDKGVEDFYEAWKTNNHVRKIDLLAGLGVSERFRVVGAQFDGYTKTRVNRVQYIDKNPLGHREYRYFNYEPAEVINVFVKHVIEKQSPVRPFYLFVNYLDPHTPYLAPTPEKIAKVVARARTDIPEIYQKLGLEKFSVRDTTIFTQMALMWKLLDNYQNKAAKDRFLTFCYEENLDYLDRQMQELFDWFKKKNLNPNTLFIVTSDHGESLGEHNLYEHGNKRLYNPEIQVPLFMLLPEQLNPLVKNTIVHRTTQSVDFFPTIIDIAGIDSELQLSGSSLVPLIFTGTDTSSRGFAISEYTGVRTITDNADKLILRENGTELYHLPDNPDESNNLAMRYPEKVKLLKEELIKQTKITHTMRMDRSTDGADAKRYDPETVKLLKTLGYIK